MIFWALFAAEFLILFLTSKFIFSALFIFSYRLFKKSDRAAIPIFILFLPGVVLHELAHMLVAEALFVKTYGLEISPKIEHGNFRMGSVEIRKTDIVRSFLIGAAPVVVGMIIIFSVLFYYLNFLHPDIIFSSFFDVLKTGGVIYIVFFITNTMFSSKKDMEGSVFLVLLVAFLAFIAILMAQFLKVDLITPISHVIFDHRILGALKLVVLLFLIPVAVNTVIFIIAKFLLRRIN